jgi:hypothetical protein
MPDSLPWAREHVDLRGSTIVNYLTTFVVSYISSPKCSCCASPVTSLLSQDKSLFVLKEKGVRYQGTVLPFCNRLSDACSDVTFGVSSCAYVMTPTTTPAATMKVVAQF